MQALRAVIESSPPAMANPALKLRASTAPAIPKNNFDIRHFSFGVYATRDITVIEIVLFPGSGQTTHKVVRAA
jgi:hypothetical protein